MAGQRNCRSGTWTGMEELDGIPWRTLNIRSISMVTCPWHDPEAICDFRRRADRECVGKRTTHGWHSAASASVDYPRHGALHVGKCYNGSQGRPSISLCRSISNFSPFSTHRSSNHLASPLSSSGRSSIAKRSTCTKNLQLWPRPGRIRHCVKDGGCWKTLPFSLP